MSGNERIYVQKNKMSMDSAAKVVLAMNPSNDLSHCDNDNDHDKDYVTKEELCDIIKGLTKTIQQQNKIWQWLRRMFGEKR